MKKCAGLFVFVAALAGSPLHGDNAPEDSLGAKLEAACLHKDVKQAEMLVNSGAPVNTTDGPHGITPLILASTRDLELVKFLLAHGAQVDLQDTDGNGPLGDACYFGKNDIVLALLDAGANPNLANHGGCTPLMTAAKRGDDATVTALLAHHADVNASGPKGSAIWWAMRKDHPGTVKLLLAAGAPAEQLSPDPPGQRDTLLALAAAKSDVALVDLLIASGASVNRHGDKGDTPLTWAVRSGARPEVIQDLLQKGADANAQRTDGETALMLSTCFQQPPVMQMLMDHGAKLETRDAEGRTALIWACYRTYSPAIRFLLDHAADVSVTDSHGETPLTYAADRGYVGMELLLEEKGAPKKALHIIARKKPDSPLSAVQSWALAAGAIYAQHNGENYFTLGYDSYESQQQLRDELKREWDVADTTSLLKEIEWLIVHGHRESFLSIGMRALNSSDQNLVGALLNITKVNQSAPVRQAAAVSYMKWKGRSGLAWDLCRRANLINKGYAAQYLSADEAWFLLLDNARQLQGHFSSWQEMNDNFLDGREIWAGVRDPEFDACAKLLLNAHDPNSPWNQSPWQTDLSIK